MIQFDFRDPLSWTGFAFGVPCSSLSSPCPCPSPPRATTNPCYAIAR